MKLKIDKTEVDMQLTALFVFMSEQNGVSYYFGLSNPNCWAIRFYIMDFTVKKPTNSCLGYWDTVRSTLLKNYLF